MVKILIPPPEQLNQLFLISSVDVLLPAITVQFTCGYTGGVVTAAECVCGDPACRSIFKKSQPAPFEVR